MSGPFGSSQWMYNSGADFYNGVVATSVRIDKPSTAYLSKSVSTGDSRTQSTYAWWMKRASDSTAAGTSLPAEIFAFGASGGGATQSSARITLEANKINVAQEDNNATTWEVITTQLLRDSTAWYHCVVVIDTTQSTAADRVKIYINGNKVTSFSTASYPSQNYISRFGLSGTNRIGVGDASGSPWSASYFNGYFADMYYLDGVVVSDSSDVISEFGEFKNGVWIAKEYTGSYGTNGFRFQFNQTGTGTGSTTTIGADTSGNDNHYTSSGIVASDCAMPDSPENGFATTLGSLAEPQDYQSYYKGTYSEGNLKVTGSASGWSNGSSNFGMTSGKWYAECRINAKAGTGYIRFGMRSRPARTYDEYFWNDDGSGQVDAATTPYSSRVGTYGAGDILMIALDLENNALYFGKNGTWENSATTSEIENGTTTNAFVASTTIVPTGDDNSGHAYFFYCQPHSTGSNITWNFGQDSSFAGLETAQGNSDSGDGTTDFYYTPPNGFLANTTVNLPEPTISPAQSTQADDYFNTVLYTGNGFPTAGTQSITGVGFQPDWIWVKTRSIVARHSLVDSVRGVGKTLSSNSTEAESTQTDSITAFGADGFTVGDNSESGSNVNVQNYTYVAWNWKAGGTAVSNTDGSITSSVSGNTDAGFSIVTYTGTGASATVGHGLDADVAMLIIKKRSSGGTARNWAVWHKALGGDNLLSLNTTGATASNPIYWGGGDHTTSVFEVNTSTTNNENTYDFVAYCFAEIEGYSKFGKYTGTGNSDGPFVFTGFRPAFVLFKNATTTATNWQINDSVRDTFNVVNKRLAPSTTDAESSSTYQFGDFLSNGFKIRETDDTWNRNGATYIYMAFAETPKKYSLGR
jgi:hypothetical protein